jgi:UDP-N-acetylmuramoyl-tripeptide--D-alanyl-D-alanine ligase
MSFVLSVLQNWLSRQAYRVLRREHPLQISVSGSVGKTTTKNMIGTVLKEKKEDDRIRVSPKSYNNDLGVPLTVFGVTAPGRSMKAWVRVLWRAFLYGYGFRSVGASVMVFELGVDMPGDMSRLLRWVHPDVAVVTALEPEGSSLVPVHTSNFSSPDALCEEELLVVPSVSPGGAVVLYADDQRVLGARHMAHAHTLLYGETDASSVRILSSRIRMEEHEHGRVPVGREIETVCFSRHQTFFILWVQLSWLLLLCGGLFVKRHSLS